MKILSGLLQIVFYIAFIGGALTAAGIISNQLPMSDPPGLTARLMTYLSANVAETASDSPFPELRSRHYAAPPALVYDIVRRAAKRLGWEVVGEDPEVHELQAVVTTKIFRFKDDVAIRVEPDGAKGSVLYVRSSSRVGKGDLGANTRHIMNLETTVRAIAPATVLLGVDEPRAEAASPDGGEVRDAGGESKEAAPSQPGQRETAG